MEAESEVGNVPGEGQAGATTRFVRAGLELLEVEVGEAEIAVIEAVDGIYRPVIDALLRADLDAVEPESDAHMSEPPR
jgi:hypothetical protein